MKIIFLDIDGVLNHLSGKNGTPDDKDFIEDKQMNILKRIVDATGAYLVLSSSWRFGWQEADRENVYSIFARSFFRLRDKFHEYGLGFLSKTPILTGFSREKEILYWLSNWEVEPIESYLILDDEAMNYSSQKQYLIQTSSREGLQPYHIEQAVKILGRNKKLKYKEFGYAMMDIDKIKKLGLDPEKGLRFFGYDEQMYIKYLLNFVNETYIEDALMKLAAGEVEGAFKAVHKLKALVEYLCIPSIDGILHEVTETLRAGKTDGVLDGLIFIKTVTKDIKAGILQDDSLCGDKR